MEDLEKGTKEMKGFAAHMKKNDINQPMPSELPGTKLPSKVYT